MLPRLLGWDIHQNDDYFLTFLVATHLATALVLLGFFWRDWVRIVRGPRPLAARSRDRARRRRRQARLAARRRHDPGRPARARCSSTRCARCSPPRTSAADLPDAQRRDALRRRAPAAPRARRRTTLPRTPTRASRERISWREAAGDRHRAGDRAAARLLALGRDDGRRPAGRPVQRGRRALRLPAGHADHRRRRRCSSCPSCSGTQGDGVRGPALVGALAAAVSAYFSVRFLMRFFETNRSRRSPSTASSPARMLTIAFAVT